MMKLPVMFKRICRGLAGMALAAGLVAVPPALAHKIDVFAYPEGGQLKGEAAYDDGSPAQGAAIRVIDARDKVVAQTKTGAEGGFTTALPRVAPPWRVEIDDGAGHHAVYRVSQADLGPSQAPAPAQAPASIPSAGLPAPPEAGAQAPPVISQAQLIQALRAELAPLKLQMARLANRDRVSLRDVIGGLGWIAGLAGLALWWRSRRPQGNSPPAQD